MPSTNAAPGHAIMSGLDNINPPTLAGEPPHIILRTLGLIANANRNWFLRNRSNILGMPAWGLRSHISPLGRHTAYEVAQQLDDVLAAMLKTILLVPSRYTHGFAYSHTAFAAVRASMARYKENGALEDQAQETLASYINTALHAARAGFFDDGDGQITTCPPGAESYLAEYQSIRPNQLASDTNLPELTTRIRKIAERKPLLISGKVTGYKAWHGTDSAMPPAPQFRLTIAGSVFLPPVPDKTSIYTPLDRHVAAKITGAGANAINRLTKTSRIPERQFLHDKPDDEDLSILVFPNPAADDLFEAAGPFGNHPF